MLMQPSQPPRFDPQLWLSAFPEIGRGYALMAGRRLVFLVEGCDGEPLTSVMAQIVGHPERQEAVKSAIERRQNGDLS
jgi:hypothetical protein